MDTGDLEGYSEPEAGENLDVGARGGDPGRFMAGGRFTILYEEGPVLAVNKDPGILTQAPEGIDSLEARVKSFLICREDKPGGCYLGIPHRLDRPASGVIVFTKHVRAANRLSEQFRGRLVEKKYWTVVSGKVPGEAGTWTDYMRKIPGRAEAELVPPIHPDAREAILNYKVMGRFSNVVEAGGDATWLEIELETGRTHQIRLQAGSRGFPILGDALYGSKVPFGPQSEDERENAIALHSRILSFTHPMTRERVALVAPLREPWRPFIPSDLI